jgi:hypothetical protein
MAKYVLERENSLGDKDQENKNILVKNALAQKKLNLNIIDLLRLDNTHKIEIQEIKKGFSRNIHTQRHLKLLANFSLLIFCILSLLTAIATSQLSTIYDMVIIFAIPYFSILFARQLLKNNMVKKYNEIQLKIQKKIGMKFIDHKIRYKNPKLIERKIKTEKLKFNDLPFISDNSLLSDKYEIDNLVRAFMQEKQELNTEAQNEMTKLYLSEEYIELEEQYALKGINLKNDYELEKAFHINNEAEDHQYHFSKALNYFSFTLSALILNIDKIVGAATQSHSLPLIGLAMLIALLSLFKIMNPIIEKLDT